MCDWGTYLGLTGDADTLAAVAGPLAESMHGIPDVLVETAKEVYLAQAPDMVEVLQRMYADVE